MNCVNVRNFLFLRFILVKYFLALFFYNEIFMLRFVKII